MKKIIFFLVLILLCAFVYFNKGSIIRYFYKTAYKNNTVYSEGNYTLDYNFEYIQKTKDFTPGNKQELMNIFYTVIDSNLEKFVIFCETGYSDCIKDTTDISKDSVTLSAINTYVHPYNMYEQIQISTNQYGIITIEINKTYTDEEIEFIEKELNKIIAENITEDMNIEEKLKSFHDYIINNTVYDTEQSILLENEQDFTSISHKANGLLQNHKALCGAYTDIMSIYLNKLGIPNYRIASDKHIWNFIYLDNNWLHLDLTWNDPVLANNKQIILHDFFLITTSKLEEFNTTKHYYDKSIYIEAS